MFVLRNYHGMTNNDRNFAPQILFCDKCTFSLNGKVNAQTWSTENQHLYLPTNSQYRGRANVWGGIYWVIKSMGHILFRTD